MKHALIMLDVACARVCTLCTPLTRDEAGEDAQQMRMSSSGQPQWWAMVRPLGPDHHSLIHVKVEVRRGGLLPRRLRSSIHRHSLFAPEAVRLSEHTIAYGRPSPLHGNVNRIHRETMCLPSVETCRITGRAWRGWAGVLSGDGRRAVIFVVCRSSSRWRTTSSSTRPTDALSFAARSPTWGSRRRSSRQCKRRARYEMNTVEKRLPAPRVDAAISRLCRVSRHQR